MDWFTFGVWAVSTGLYWLTYKKPKKQKPAKAEAPTTKDGSSLNIVWGTVTVSAPTNTKFDFLSKSTNTVFAVQDIVCLGYIDKFLGMFIGDVWIPYGLKAIPLAQESQVYDYNGANQPIKFGTFEHPAKFQAFSFGATYENLVQSDDDANYYYTEVLMKNALVNNMMGTGSLGMGRAGVDTLPYSDIMKDLLFPSAQYPDRVNLPHWDYLTMVSYHALVVSSSVATRAYKVQRVVQYMDGTPAPSWGRVYRYTPVVSMLHRLDDVIPLITLYNVCHS